MNPVEQNRRGVGADAEESGLPHGDLPGSRQDIPAAGQDHGQEEGDGQVEEIGVHQPRKPQNEKDEEEEEKTLLPGKGTVHSLYSLRVPTSPVGLMIRMIMIRMKEIPSAHPDPSGT